MVECFDIPVLVRHQASGPPQPHNETPMFLLPIPPLPWALAGSKAQLDELLTFLVHRSKCSLLTFQQSTIAGWKSTMKIIHRSMFIFPLENEATFVPTRSSLSCGKVRKPHSHWSATHLEAMHCTKGHLSRWGWWGWVRQDGELSGREMMKLLLNSWKVKTRNCL